MTCRYYEAQHLDHDNDDDDNDNDDDDDGLTGLARMCCRIRVYSTEAYCTRSSSSQRGQRPHVATLATGSRE